MHEFVRLSGDDGEGAFPMVRLRVLPEFPDASHTKRLLAAQRKFVFRFLPSLGHLLPLEDRIPRNDDAAIKKSIFPERGGLDAFGASIE